MDLAQTVQTSDVRARPRKASQQPTRPPPGGKPLALVVFLENVGYINGVNLPRWAMAAIDWTTEEYAKLLLRLLGAHRRYDHIAILEDAQATGENLVRALVELSVTHTVDQLLLVHGQDRCLVGYKGREFVDAAVLNPLVARCAQDTSLLDLRVVYGLNCYGASLASIWLALGAQAVSGAWGVNWLPEPSLSLFLRKWLNGSPFSEAVGYSFRRARAVGRLLWRDRANGSEHPNIAGSRQIVYGLRDVTISSPTDGGQKTTDKRNRDAPSQPARSHTTTA